MTTCVLKSIITKLQDSSRRLWYFKVFCTTKYEPLYGTCVHLGGLNGGHYYSICKNKLDNCWRVYNDSNVSKINESEVFNNHPYCLFYKRV